MTSGFTSGIVGAMPYRKVRPMPNEKVERNKEVVECHRERPELTYRELAVLFGVSWQRIYQIVRRVKC